MFLQNYCMIKYLILRTISLLHTSISRVTPLDRPNWGVDPLGPGGVQPIQPLGPGGIQPIGPRPPIQPIAPLGPGGIQRFGPRPPIDPLPPLGPGGVQPIAPLGPGGVQPPCATVCSTILNII